MREKVRSPFQGPLLSILFSLSLFSSFSVPAFAREPGAPDDRECGVFLETRAGFHPAVDAWMELKRPFLGKRPRGLGALREAAARGVTWVLPSDSAELERSGRFSAEQQRELEYLAGAAIRWVHPGEALADPQFVTGLALHPGESPPLLNAVRGEVNPHLGYARLHARLDKLGEMQLARRIAPEMVPLTEKYGAAPLVGSSVFSRKQNPFNNPRALETRLIQALQELFATARQRFPNGVVLKHAFQFTSPVADAESAPLLLNPDTQNADAMLAQQLARRGIFGIQRHADTVNTQIGSAAWMRALTRAGDRDALIVAALLYAPEQIVLQERLAIARSPSGKPLEWRVDFLDGEAVRFLPRHSAEIPSDQGYEATALLNRFFARAQTPLRYLAGSADVVLLEDGTLRILGFNFGAENLDIHPLGPSPVLAAEFLTMLVPLPPPLLEDLDRAASGTREQQESALNRLMRSVSHVPYLPAHEGWPELAWVDGFRRIRNQRVAAWRAAGARARTLSLLERELAALAADFPGSHPNAIDRLHAMLQDWKPAAHAEAKR